jgi:chromosome partition protein MukE
MEAHEEAELSESRYHSLEDVVRDETFPGVDLALRRGVHISQDDPEPFAFIADAQVFLEEFYRRYGCELVRSPDQFFYLAPSGDRLGRRHLSAGEMLVGQALALAYLDPAMLEQGGVVERTQIVSRLSSLVGDVRLIRALNFRRRPSAERVAQEVMRAEIEKALRSLAGLGFVDLVDDVRMRLRRPVLRFADAVRGLEAQAAALERLIREGRAIAMDSDAEEETE